MFNLGLTEILALSAIALLVIGPKQLPEVARSLARFLNEMKRSSAHLTKPLMDMKNEMRSAQYDVQQSVQEKVHEYTKELDLKESLASAEAPSSQSLESSASKENNKDVKS